MPEALTDAPAQNTRQERDIAHDLVSSLLATADAALKRAAHEWLVRENRVARDAEVTYAQVRALVERDYPGGWDQFVGGLHAETEPALLHLTWVEGMGTSILGDPQPYSATTNVHTWAAPNGYHIVHSRVGYAVHGYDPVEDRWRVYEDRFLGPTGVGWYVTFEDAETAIRLYEHAEHHAEHGTDCTLDGDTSCR